MSRNDPQGPCCALPAPAGPDDQHGEDGQGARIYGKQGCPHTDRARAALPLARFIDVLAEPEALEEMLRLTDGQRRVPVIVWPADHGGETVEVGFRRGA